MAKVRKENRIADAVRLIVFLLLCGFAVAYDNVTRAKHEVEVYYEQAK